MRVASAGGKETAGIDYALVDIDKTVLAHVGASVPPSLAGGFGIGSARAPTLPLGVGDIVQVAVFESQSGASSFPPRREAGLVIT